MLRPGRVTHADADPCGGQASEEVLDGGAVEGAGRAGDDDHAQSFRGPETGRVGVVTDGRKRKLTRKVSFRGSGDAR
ncbi:hypothetical protein GCM10007368_24580 [Isoptericola cucumis]|uniref:Uncharacterized protein n=1 Tax=Isoptericola cucumis TaxID=1776856 RepID=A0ABQ2B6L3_9MICO|nr:hypothetical protein GCM10007368_24580 [Isoptericola cucumis]